MTKIAVAIIHGIGIGDRSFDDRITEEPGFFHNLSSLIRERFAMQEQISIEEVSDRVVFEPIYWAPLVQVEQNELWEKVNGDRLNFERLRFFVISVLGDTIAYQVTSQKDRRLYDKIHAQFAETLSELVKKAGQNAPLCVICHSLGCAIASNYFYDLQEFKQTGGRRQLIDESVMQQIGDTPLERGETLSLFYTMGCPLALWSLQQKLDRPIQVPAKDLSVYHPQLSGEWLNFFDRSDILAYPLKPISPEYERVVTADWQVNVGNILTSWNPISHVEYWTSPTIADRIATALAKTWNAINL